MKKDKNWGNAIIDKHEEPYKAPPQKDNKSKTSEKKSESGKKK